MSDQVNVANNVGKPSDDEVRDAVKVLLRYTGDDPTREGLLETPNVFVRRGLNGLQDMTAIPRSIFTSGLSMLADMTKSLY